MGQCTKAALLLASASLLASKKRMECEAKGLDFDVFNKSRFRGCVVKKLVSQNAKQFQNLLPPTIFRLRFQFQSSFMNCLFGSSEHRLDWQKKTCKDFRRNSYSMENYGMKIFNEFSSALSFLSQFHVIHSFVVDRALRMTFYRIVFQSTPCAADFIMKISLAFWASSILLKTVFLTQLMERFESRRWWHIANSHLSMKC